MDEAAAALDRAGSALGTHGRRYAEGLLLLLRARVLQAHGEPAATAERALALSTERAAHFFAHRAKALLTCMKPGNGTTRSP
ncbi:hypothetical protein [Streptomyces sasae]|uniref:hypothetical protein n=1 Tax=Streptomyces sasae TaxID=1266772 RepID=UPI00292F42C3|nr:hypothetical protein [Streptomyces sasae]